MKTIKIIIFIVLILYIINVYTRYKLKQYDNSLTKRQLTECNYRTGDIVFFRNACPLYFFGENGINIDIHIVKNIAKSFYYNYQKYFSHVGVIVIINNTPYLYHLTNKHQYDLLSKKYVIGKSCLVNIYEIENYDGFAYISHYKGPNISIDIKDIQNNTMYLHGNLFDVLKTTIFQISHYKENRGVCTDLVHRFCHKYGIDKNKNKAVDVNYLINFVNQHNYYSDIHMIRTGYYNSLTK